MSLSHIESSAFDQKSAEREKILGEAPHIQVLESCAENLRKYGATEEEVAAYLAPYAETLNDYYSKIVAQENLLEGAAKDLSRLKLAREVEKATDGNETKLADLTEAHKKDLADILMNDSEEMATA